MAARKSVPINYFQKPRFVFEVKDMLVFPRSAFKMVRRTIYKAADLEKSISISKADTLSLSSSKQWLTLSSGQNCLPLSLAAFHIFWYL